MAHINNILKDKLFVFSGPSKTSEAEKEILDSICYQENLGALQKSQTVSNGEDYDSYKVVTNEGKFLIKTSLGGKSVLEKDFNVLKALESYKLAPKPVSLGLINYGENIDFSVVSFEPLQSCEDFGKSIFLFNGEQISAKLQSITVPGLDSLESAISKRFEAVSFSNQPEFAELLETNSPNYNLLSEEILSAKRDIELTFKSAFGGKYLCHGSFKTTNVLLGAHDLKIINWQNAFAANSLINLADLRMAFDFDEGFEYKLFNSFKKDYSWDEYIQIRNFWASLKLLEYVFFYIREIYLFKSLRQDKILEIFSSFCRNFKFFEHIPAFRKNKEQIVGLFSQPML